MNHTNKLLMFSALTLFAAAFSSCKKDETQILETENFKGVLVVNEGGFGKSNGSVGLYKPGDKSYFDAFKQANGRPLGDIVQSIAKIDNQFYIAVNNSNKIEVVNVSDFKSVASISTTSPRYILKTVDGKAYISNLYSNTLKVLSLADNSISKDIDIHHSSNAMALLSGKVYVSTYDNKLMVVNTANDSLTDSIAVSSGLGPIVNAGSGKIVVLCTGLVDWGSGNVLENGKIMIFNADSNRAERTVPLSSGSYGGSLVYNSSNNTLYFSLGNNKVYKMDMSGIISDFVTLPAGAVYGINCNPINSEIYITDAGDFSSEGKVYIYNQSGVKTGEFTAGVAPNGVLINN